MIFAYLDPGAGTLFFQALLAAALTVPFLVRGKIASAVSRLKGRGLATDAHAEEKHTSS
jgi:hypothetical protein